MNNRKLLEAVSKVHESLPAANDQVYGMARLALPPMATEYPFDADEDDYVEPLDADTLEGIAERYVRNLMAHHPKVKWDIRSFLVNSHAWLDLKGTRSAVQKFVFWEICMGHTSIYNRDGFEEVFGALLPDILGYPQYEQP